jgi:hypothetical protein
MARNSSVFKVSAADQSVVHAMPVEECCGVSWLNAAAMLDDLVGGRLAKLLTKLASTMGTSPASWHSGPPR